MWEAWSKMQICTRVGTVDHMCARWPFMWGLSDPVCRHVHVWVRIVMSVDVDKCGQYSHTCAGVYTVGHCQMYTPGSLVTHM